MRVDERRNEGEERVVMRMWGRRRGRMGGEEENKGIEKREASMEREV